MLPSTTLAARTSRDLRLTRALLERLPAASMSWKPHPRAFSLSGLATHLAQLPHWGVRILTGEGYDLAGSQRHHEPMDTPEKVLALFDRHVDEWDGHLAAIDARGLGSPWRLWRGNEVLELLTRADAVERYLLHHLIHHRGQLSVYLRQLDVPLPPIYGPTADEEP